MAKRPARKTIATPSGPPNLGLVCVTFGQECRFRAITRTRYLQLDEVQKVATLRELYWDNFARLNRTISFCHRKGISLYRATSSLFPMSDEPLGAAVLEDMSANLSGIGRRIKRLKIRMLAHPDQFVVLSSDSPATVETSVTILRKHAMAFDLMGLPRSAWAPLILHGGKSDRADALVARIAALPINVKRRLVLENDEYSYSSAEILDVCRRAKVPMVFDNLHHAIHEKIDRYDHPDFAKFTRLAAETWPDPAWQIVHLSNGNSSALDRNHSLHIKDIPPAFHRVPWIEIEARGKDLAIAKLQAEWHCGK